MGMLALLLLLIVVSYGVFKFGFFFINSIKLYLRAQSVINALILSVLFVSIKQMNVLWVLIVLASLTVFYSYRMVHLIQLENAFSEEKEEV